MIHGPPARPRSRNLPEAFPMIVRARHVAPIRHIPRGGRHERLDMLMVESDAELRVLPASDFEPVDVGPNAPAYKARDGELWEELSDGYGDAPRTPVPLKRFLEWLSGAEGTLSSQPPGNRFQQSPLYASVPSVTSVGGINPTLTRGDPREPKSRQVVRDGRARAAAAAAAYLRDDIAVAGDRAFVRCHPLAWTPNDGEGRILIVQPTPHMQHSLNRFFDLSRIDEFMVQGNDRTPVRVPPEVQAILMAMTRQHQAGDAVRYHANILSQVAVASIDAAPNKGSPLPGSVVEAGNRLRPYAEMASIGALDDDEVEAALAMCRDLAPELRHHGAHMYMVNWADVTERFRTGAIRATIREDADEASLSGLAR
jgi:hypothetical protein